LALCLVVAGCATGASTTPDTTVPSTTAVAPIIETTTTQSATSATAEAATTTSAARTEAPPVAGTVSGSVGYVGCSMSQNSVEGYQDVGGTNMWSFRAPYGGGSVGRWHDDIDGDRGRYWQGFERELVANPDTGVIWWNLCTVKSSPQDSFDNAVAILAEIEARIPGAEVYVSAQPLYANGHLCGLAGEGGPEYMVALADELIGAGLALAGPTMGPLDQSETRDGCHANAEGKTVLGNQLLDFFG
jgi:hypothetical protein